MASSPKSQEVVCHLPGPAVGTSGVASIHHLALFSWEAQTAVPPLGSRQWCLLRGLIPESKPEDICCFHMGLLACLELPV